MSSPINSYSNVSLIIIDNFVIFFILINSFLMYKSFKPVLSLYSIIVKTQLISRYYISVDNLMFRPFADIQSIERVS